MLRHLIWEPSRNRALPHWRRFSWVMTMVGTPPSAQRYSRREHEGARRQSNSRCNPTRKHGEMLQGKLTESLQKRARQKKKGINLKPQSVFHMLIHRYKRKSPTDVLACWSAGLLACWHGGGQHTTSCFLPDNATPPFHPPWCPCSLPFRLV